MYVFFFKCRNQIEVKYGPLQSVSDEIITSLLISSESSLPCIMDF